MSRRGHRPTADWLVAAGCAVVALAALAVAPAVAAADPAAALVLPEPGGLAWWLGVATLLVQSALLLWRRTAPSAVLLAVAAGVPVAAACGLGDVTGVATVAVLVGVLTLGLQHPVSRAWPALLGAAVLVAAGVTAAGVRVGDGTAAAIGAGLLQGVGTVGLPLVVAVLLAARRETRLARESQAAAIAREHDALVQAAVARERTAMARELHDIAAHHLSGIAVMTAAIGTQIDSDPAGAKEAVAQVRRQSTSVLRDLRRLVGLLREQDAHSTDPSRTRPESLAGVAALVADASAAGRDVGLTVLGEEEPLDTGVGPLAQLAAYRMVQEALANAARHAPGARAEVVVDHRDPDAVLVSVRNARPEVAPTPEGREGFGIIGMRERAELTGSRVEHGVTPDGGWQVTLRIPREHDYDAGSDRESEDA